MMPAEHGRETRTRPMTLRDEEAARQPAPGADNLRTALERLRTLVPEHHRPAATSSAPNRQAFPAAGAAACPACAAKRSRCSPASASSTTRPRRPTGPAAPAIRLMRTRRAIPVNSVERPGRPQMPWTGHLDASQPSSASTESGFRDR